MSSWDQATINLNTRSKGCYLVTEEIISKLPQIKNYEIGSLNLFLKHTSAGITLNENFDDDVQTDMESILDRIVPQRKDYLHSSEGDYDMPSHAFSSIIGVSLNIPITNGRLALGTWQGIWLVEGRIEKHNRKIVATINGQKK
ncbi:uncharacterized protein KGF55_000592 [Candida pseudojiufengensis]|uniref:uncharacterized protein n=1 Tax=Candida pseudojiufengensis TaxID=497109 RepID=UPI002224F215|nr:uncharacterized protein KGF55_000592 [Candida pseudojiufengensis]KAI5966283.1 hypothetical protein KGF55_000592 [Candida pseudojiufengensis]